MVRIGGDDPVVALAGPGVVDARVVDHVVRAERPDEIGLVAAADPGHLRAHRLRDLDGERPDVAGGALDEHPVAGLDCAPIAQPERLERQDRGVGEG